MGDSNDVEREFHETWLGMVQPSEGLVVGLPVLLQAQCMERHPPSLQHSLMQLLTKSATNDNGAKSPRRGSSVPPANDNAVLQDLPRFLHELLGLAPELWDAAPGYRSDLAWAGVLAEELSYYAPEGPQSVAPTLGLRKKGTATTGYELLLWELPLGTELDKPEVATGPWSHPAAAKFDRLLRAVRVPIGVLSNRRVLRVVYAPHGEASGHIDFRLDDMVTVGGRPILDALIMLLHAQRFFAVSEERSLPALLRESRKYQATVTTELGEQVFEALTILLRGFEAAAERDGRGRARLDQALARENDHLYKGLLAVLLRMVFVLYAEDRGLLPIEHPLYEQHYSLFALFKQLQVDHGQNPDSMSRRFGAWGRVIALFRAVFLGVRAGEFAMPARRGALFDPNSYAFLEGWDPAGSSPISEPELRAAVEVPTIDDETMFLVLQRLIVLDGQRVSYRTLGVEQIGSVYEGLMGYHVERMQGAAVRTRPHGVWLSAETLLAVPPAQRGGFLVDSVRLDKAPATKLAESVKGMRAEAAFELLHEHAMGRTKLARAANVAHADQLVLQPGSERRRTSSHYTPPSLSSKVVARTLEPLLKCMTEEGAIGPSSRRILMLRVCDPAMGSGAFLVEACRMLADELVAAWTREGIVARYADPVTYARRRVAQCCLYGIDKNAAAVELAKLSLWLVTMAKERPFTFLDANLRHGDSLVGLSLPQIRAFHWRPEEQLELGAGQIDGALKEAVESRQKLHDFALKENGFNVDPREKEIVHKDAEDALARVRLIADVCLGAFFAKDSDKERERERVRRLDVVQRWLAERNGKASALQGELTELQRALRQQQVPFHWPLEFPDVFVDERPDPLAGDARSGAAWMDAFVGNPPYSGKNGISASGGLSYLPWLQAIHAGAHGNADLAAHFYRRTAALLGDHGTIGFVTTNTIRQGDTRSTGLQFLSANEFTIYDASSDIQWADESENAKAAVTVCRAILAKGKPVSLARCRFDDTPCSTISSQLSIGAERGDPVGLGANARGAFVGTYVLGMGFTLDPDERKALIARDRRNASRIFPYLGGEEVNTNPDQGFDRYVINFGTMSLEQAEAWPDLIRIVREKVKPERDKLNDNADGRRRKANWWQYGRWTPALYEAIASLPRCLVTAIVSKHLMFSFQPTDRVFSHKLYVFPIDHHTPFAVLQSRVHEPWARLLSSTLEDRLNYSASDCFETFPFPESNPRTVIPALEKIGEELYTARASYMLETQRGLTKTYNALKDSACTDRPIVQLRKLHERMDAAVLDAYGWSDLSVPPFCATNDQDRAAQEAFKREVIERLFVLNAQRAEEEARLGLGKPKKGTAKKQTPAAAPKTPAKLKPPKATRPTARTRSSRPARPRRSNAP
jgi:hypothetical protein